jgi:hypothetical protein
VSLAPAEFLGEPVPAPIAAAWRTWAAAEWRKQCYWARNQPHAPDQRCTVVPPGGLCELHLGFWGKERNRMFDPVRGYRWPGHPGSMFDLIGSSVAGAREWRRAEWDDKASEQMQAIGALCLAGTSPQCTGPRTCAGCRLFACTCKEAL